MEKKTSRVISGSPSIFLDTLRICAAFTVLFIHAFDTWFPSQAFDQSKPGDPSHAAVIVFFVLSGFVIAHTTLSKNRGGMQYAQARLTRLSSVVIPALVITALAAYIIGNINPAMLLVYSRGFSGFRYIISGLFMNEFWFYSAAPPLNIALWSLSFEFWYYTIFGLWFFRKPGVKSLLVALAVCMFAGPKILLMMPIWLAGYMAYRLPRPSLSAKRAWLFVFTGIFAACLVVIFVPGFPYKIGHKPLYYANQFVTDWLVGIFVGAALWVVPTGDSLGTRSKWANWFRNIADLTFPLYVLHYPLLILWRCLFGFRINDAVQFWEATISVMTVSFFIGVILEKQRFLWSQLFKWLLGSARNLFLKINRSKTIVNAT
jgi:peptidoglycan/LPS O-acetylase OafA/YrhL